MSTKKSNYLSNITLTDDDSGGIVNYVKIYKDGLNTSIIAATNDKYVQLFDIQKPEKPKQRMLCHAEVNIAKLNPTNPSIIAVFCD
jgi:hypothetical protein